MTNDEVLIALMEKTNAAIDIIAQKDRIVGRVDDSLTSVGSNPTLSANIKESNHENC